MILWIEFDKVLVWCGLMWFDVVWLKHDHFYIIPRTEFDKVWMGNNNNLLYPQILYGSIIHFTQPTIIINPSDLIGCELKPL